MTIDERAEMSTCNLTETIHNMWLQQSCNKMTYLNDAMVDDLICMFMQIANCRFWLKGGSTNKGPNLVSLKLKATTKCEDLTDVVKSYFNA